MEAVRLPTALDCRAPLIFVAITSGRSGVGVIAVRLWSERGNGDVEVLFATELLGEL